MKLSAHRDQHLKDTGNEDMNEAFLQLSTIGMGDMGREATRADLVLYRTQVDNNMLAFCEGVRYVLLKSGISKTEVNATITKLQEGLR